MKIVIDARMFGVKHAGIGRYVENLIKQLLIVDSSNDYTLIVRKEDHEKIKNNVKIVIADARHYSVKEQLLIPSLLAKENPDLVHFPHFNVPLLYQGKFVVTIHDLLWHEMKGREVTTLPSYLYDIKYAGYRLVFANAVKRAQKILVPSIWVKNKLKDTYKDIDDKKIVVTYEGVDDIYIKDQKSKIKDQNLLEHYNLNKPFLIYTGSAYPHKNLNKLLEAIKKLDLQLAVVCVRDVFYKKLETEINNHHLNDKVKLLGFVSDEELTILYQYALAFVLPSLSEGFGLPGLEAMSSGCPVLCSDIPVFREIYANSAVYFNPKNENDIANKIDSINKNADLRNELIKKGFLQAKKYSWEKMARETKKIYESCNSL